MSRTKSGLRLRQSHSQDRCYYVEVDGDRVGRVRFNDGWVAALYNPGTGGYEPLAGSWQSRLAAVDGLVDEWEAER